MIKHNVCNCLSFSLLKYCSIFPNQNHLFNFEYTGIQSYQFIQKMQIEEKEKIYENERNRACQKDKKSCFACITCHKKNILICSILNTDANSIVLNFYPFDKPCLAHSRRIFLLPRFATFYMHFSV